MANCRVCGNHLLEPVLPKTRGNICKSCFRAYQRSYWKKNQAKEQARNTAYYRAHPEMARAKTKAWIEASPNNKERSLERSRKWRVDNPEQDKLNHMKWREKNKDKLKQSHRNNKAKRKGACGFSTPQQVAWRVAMFGGKCWMCGNNADQIDHVIPLCRGGSNWPANLRPACAFCNNSKNGKDWRSFLRLKTL